jgi:hypothetical protein
MSRSSIYCMGLCSEKGVETCEELAGQDEHLAVDHFRKRDGARNGWESLALQLAAG